MDKKRKRIVEKFLGDIPVIGGFLKELAKTEPFQERIREANEKINENLRGSGGKWEFRSNISLRPIIKEVKKDTSEITIKKDYFYGRKGDRLKLAVKVPSEETILKIEDKNLIITSDKFEKKIELPDFFNRIKKKEYKKGVLIVELAK